MIQSSQSALGVTCIDLFAGAGVFSTGAVAAGATVVWAGNHWQIAIDAHRLNHPDTQHACVDLRLVDWARLPRHDVILASPACQGHSRARGSDKPHHDALRATAWIVVEAVEATEPRGFIVENVPEFLKWQLFPDWLSALNRLGYHVRHNVLDAADLGVPQHRRRMFLVGAKKQVRLPVLLGSMIQHVPVESALDLHVPGNPDLARLGARTRHQIECGIAEHNGQPFLVSYYGTARSGGVTRTVRRPCGTLTTKDRYGLWNQGTYRMLSVQEMRRIMGFPDGYVLPVKHADAVKSLGNAVCPPVASYALSHLVPSL